MNTNRREQFVYDEGRDAGRAEAMHELRDRIRRGESLAVLRELWPDPMTRPLYTVDDMATYAKRVLAESSHQDDPDETWTAA